eukprot:TRINITY_DN11711_c0_g1_i2.p2 TRINITY_DN11711_c0_g1~~TRINITY_DN11711_c0_g1_i2.p2  ORF type:complete len:202 (-),score=-9.33 TRINITY_DN11711_c0_g1_i2:150-755(-)
MHEYKQSYTIQCSQVHNFCVKFLYLSFGVKYNLVLYRKVNQIQFSYQVVLNTNQKNKPMLKNNSDLLVCIPTKYWSPVSNKVGKKIQYLRMLSLLIDIQEQIRIFSVQNSYKSNLYNGTKFSGTGRAVNPLQLLIRQKRHAHFLNLVIPYPARVRVTSSTKFQSVQKKQNLLKEYFYENVNNRVLDNYVDQVRIIRCQIKI